MNRVRKRPAIIVIFLFVLVAGALGSWIYTNVRNGNNKNDEQESFVSAVDTAKEAVKKDGITNATAGDALFIATDQLNAGKTAEARASVEAINDDILSNDQIKNKYVILLDSYRLESNKEGYRGVMAKYKEIVATRNDPVLTQETSHLNDAYVEAIFTTPETVPVEEEVP